MTEYNKSLLKLFSHINFQYFIITLEQKTQITTKILNSKKDLRFINILLPKFHENKLI